MATQGFGRASPIQRPDISVSTKQKSRPPGPAFLLSGRTKPVSDFVSRQGHHGLTATANAFGQGHGLWQQAVEVEAGCRSEEHTSELQSRPHLVCRLLLE